VIVYDIPEWKLWFLRLFVHTPYIGLPNILTQKQLVPEYVGPLSQKKDAVLSHIRVLCTEPAYHTLATNIAETMRSLLEENMKPCLKDIWKTTLSQALMKQVEVV